MSNNELFDTISKQIELYTSKFKEYIPIQNYYELRKTKKVKTSFHEIKILPGVIYSGVGSTIHDKKQEACIEIILDTLLQEKNKCIREYLSGIYFSIALFQLHINDNLGFWLDEVIEKSREMRNGDENYLVMNWSSLKSSLFENEIRIFVEKFILKLIAKFFPKSDRYTNCGDIIAYFSNMGIDLNLSQIGMLILCQIDGDIDKYLDQAEHMTNKHVINYFRGAIPLSKMFVPIETSQCKFKWRESKHTECLSYTKWGNNVYFRYTFVDIPNIRQLKAWAISSMINNCYHVLAKRQEEEVKVPYIINHEEYVMNLQLTIEKSSQRVCIKFDNTVMRKYGENVYANCTDHIKERIDIQDFHFSLKFIYHFTTMTFMMFLRMLIYLHPNLKLGNKYNDAKFHMENKNISYFRYRNKLCFGDKPTLSFCSNDVGHIYIDGKNRVERSKRVNDIYKFIYKYYINNKYVCETVLLVKNVLNVCTYLNDKSVIIGGAEFIKNVHGNDICLDEEGTDNFCLHVKKSFDEHSKYVNDRYKIVTKYYV